MKRVLLTISYDGTAYHGWQVQPNGITVQSVIQDCLLKLLGVNTSVTGCSRTDAGVHAREFCCHIDCADNIPDKAFLLGLNSLLPKDIRVTDVKIVADDFHARYNSIGKKYTYGFYLGKQNPFNERYFYHLDTMPDIKLMNEFCKTVIGKHDFYGFSSSGRTVEDTVRNVKECYIKTYDNKIYFTIIADGFLYNMVRIIVGTALDVGYGRLPYDIALMVFKEKNRSFAGDTMPAKALFLEKVFY